MKVSHLKPGNLIVIRNGARGEQVALVSSVTSINSIRAFKWLARGQRWTDKRTVYDSEVLRYAHDPDIRKRRVKGPLPTY
jgi:hypothetical protein